MAHIEVYPININHAKEYINVDESNRSSDGCLRVVSYVDKETNQFIAYVPSLEISGYGDTEKEAKDLLWVSVDKFFEHLFLNTTHTYDVLSGLGWKKSWWKKREFSRTYIDVKGELKDFAIADTIKEEEVQLT